MTNPDGQIPVRLRAPPPTQVRHYGLRIAATLTSRRHRLARAALAVTLLALTGVALPGSTHAADDALPASTATPIEGEAATALAEKYAPIIAIQTQAEPCGAGEPYYPADAAVVLDQPDIVLLDAAGNLLTKAPSAADLFHAPEGSNFDMPGNSVRPGCDYERRFGWRTGKPPVQYARVVRDSDDPSRIVVQYWEYFVYNDWNNLHESDWEMVMLVFHADTPETALAAGPENVVLSQHYGNERRAWADVQKHGDRPVVYPAAGSHAFFFSQKVWFGMDGDAGFGCDDTTGPSTEMDPAVKLLPATPTADNGFGWLGFVGRWGQRQSLGLNDSEQGIQYTRQWGKPIAYMNSGRTSAVSVPNINFGVTTFFCRATVVGSGFINYMSYRPWLLLAIIVVVVAFIVWLVKRTRWKPAPPLPVAMERRGGRIMNASLQLVRQNLRRYLPVSALALLGGVLAAITQRLVLDHTFLGTLMGMGAKGGATGLAASLAAGAAETIPLMIVALVVGVHITHHLDEARDTKVIRHALKGRALLPTIVLLAVLLLTGPFMFFLLPAWVVAPSVGTAENAPVRAALGRAWNLSRRHRIRTFVLTAFAFSVSLLTAPLVGIVMLLITDKSFVIMNVVAGAINAITLPWLSVVMYLMYTDLAAREQGDDPATES